MVVTTIVLFTAGFFYTFLVTIPLGEFVYKNVLMLNRLICVRVYFKRMNSIISKNNIVHNFFAQI